MKFFKFIVALCCVLSFIIGYAPQINIASAQEEIVPTVLATEEVPTEYNSDYTNLSYVTSAKNQGSYGLCWAFATIACAEADAIKNHSASTDLDLSEWHLAYFAYQGERPGTGDTVSPAEGINYYEVGGYDYLSACVLSSWVGLADEEVAPYETLEADSTSTLPSESISEASYYIKNVLMYDINEETDVVKNAIMEYGAISVAYYASDSYLSSNYAQYCSDSSLVANHAVTIVGWDDDYSRTNFKLSKRPTSNGAWLVKNSWGKSWGLNGYFWLSYEDATLTGGTAYDVVPKSEYDYNYQHDGGISQSYLEQSSRCAPFANVFEANGLEVIKAVGVTTVDGTGDAKFTSDGISYNLKIYVNPDSLPDGSTDFEFTNLVHEQDGVILQEGFFTIDLTEAVYLQEGDVFVAVIDTKAFVACDITTQVKAYDSSGETFVLANSTSSVSAGQSYYTTSSGLWRDSGVNLSYPFNIRIKVFTSSVAKGEVTVSSKPTVSLRYGQTLASAVITGGSAVDSSTGLTVDGKWSFSDDTIIPSNGEEIEIVFTPFDIDYSSVTTSIQVEVSSVTPTLVVEGFSPTITFGEEFNFTYTLVNEYATDCAVSGEVAVYCKVGDGEPTLFVGGIFTAFETDEAVTVTFIFEYVSDNLGYDSFVKEVVFEVVPIDGEDASNKEGDDASNQESDDTSNKEGEGASNQEGDADTPIVNDNQENNSSQGFSCVLLTEINDCAVVFLPLLFASIFVLIKRKSI